MLLALTRAVPPSLAACELTHLDRVPIDVGVAAAQHVAYEEALRALGCRVERVAPAPDLADSVFIEDTAVVLDEIAVITRPGAESRRGELAGVAAALSPYRALHYIAAPATMDGGDVLQVGQRIFVGLSSRTNESAARQLASIVGPLGYSVETLTVEGCLHLKSAVTAASDSVLVLDPAHVDARLFKGIDCVPIDPAEPSGANVLRLGGTVVCAASAAATARRLEARGFTVMAVDASELAKAEGALTCCSLILSDRSSSS